MKRWLYKGTLMAAIVLPALSGTAWAGGNDDLGCSNATLKGAYAFSVLTVASATGPGVVVGLGTFDGRGGFTQIDYPGDGLSMTPPLTAFRTGRPAATRLIQTAPASKKSISAAGSGSSRTPL
jgi:hypothetical protein